MEIQGIATSTAPAAARPVDKEKTDFLQLLVTQMRTQDPLEPMSTAEMMGQLTQLKMIESLEDMREDSAWQLRAAMAGLVGMTAKGVSIEGESLDGLVGSVRWTGSEPVVVIDGKNMWMRDITEVRKG